jgi:hypothetical protein
LFSSNLKLKVLDCLHVAENTKRASPVDMFEDIYDVLPKHLVKQKQEMLDHLKMYKDQYPMDMYEKL